MPLQRVRLLALQSQEGSGVEVDVDSAAPMSSWVPANLPPPEEGMRAVPIFHGRRLNIESSLEAEGVPDRATLRVAYTRSSSATEVPGPSSHARSASSASAAGRASPPSSFAILEQNPHRVLVALLSFILILLWATFAIGGSRYFNTPSIIMLGLLTAVLIAAVHAFN